MRLTRRGVAAHGTTEQARASRIDLVEGANHVREANPRGRARESESAGLAALGLEHAFTRELMQDLRQVVGRDVEMRREISGTQRHRRLLVFSEEDGGAKGVFSRLVQHAGMAGCAMCERTPRARATITT